MKFTNGNFRRSARARRSISLLRRQGVWVGPRAVWTDERTGRHTESSLGATIQSTPGMSREAAASVALRGLTTAKRIAAVRCVCAWSTVIVWFLCLHSCPRCCRLTDLNLAPSSARTLTETRVGHGALSTAAARRPTTMRTVWPPTTTQRVTATARMYRSV